MIERKEPRRIWADACQWCAQPIDQHFHGRPRRYCRASCRQRAYEQRKVDRAAAAVGVWLDCVRAGRDRAERDLTRVLDLLGPDAPVLAPRLIVPPWFPCPQYGQLFGSRVKDAEFMQKRCPVGRGPSLNT